MGVDVEGEPVCDRCRWGREGMSRVESEGVRDGRRLDSRTALASYFSQSIVVGVG